MIDYQGNCFTDESIVFPKGKYVFRHVPKDIMKSYEAAIKTSKVDLLVSLIAIRADVVSLIDFIETIKLYSSTEKSLSAVVNSF